MPYIYAPFWEPRVYLRLVFLLIIATFILFGKEEQVFAQAPSLHAQAEEAMKEEKYDTAIKLSQAHLRRWPRDFDAWHTLAVSYYYSGLPRRALQHLRNVYRHTPRKSYNLLYQGLCHLSMGSENAARVALTNAARYVDEPGSRATFELAVMEYNARENEKAMYWIELYQKRYPGGPFIRHVQHMAYTISRGQFVAGLEGNKKPDMEQALYRYNRYSLSPRPHFWFLQLGGGGETTSGRKPINTGGTEPTSSQGGQMLFNGGIGIGPIRSGKSLALAGYSYHQEWITDSERFRTWAEEPFDHEYFAFRTDIMERTHRLFGDYRYSLTDKVYLGVYGRLDFARIGSSLLTGSEDPELQNARSIADRSLLIPWVGINYMENYYTLFYLYMRKEINSEAPNFSNKTYDLFDSEIPLMSYGLSHSMEFPQQKLSVNIEGFLYEFVYNDQWFDYTRMGGIVGAKYEFHPRFFLSALGGFYNDTYQIPRLKQQSCRYVPRTTEGGASRQASSMPVSCPRQDQGLLFGAGISWNHSQFRRFELSLTGVENKNPDQNLYDSFRINVLGTFTFAFPSVERVMRYVGRFADTAFTKEAE